MRYFGSNFQPNAKQHNNSHLPIEQSNIITTRHLQNSLINNFVDRISLVEQAEAKQFINVDYSYHYLN
ncbi:15716_t:CDS:2 [Entrophospora sp. SA101]|nr:15716_t:CDS:2 [Entrophospora sp. SA101]